MTTRLVDAKVSVVKNSVLSTSLSQSLSINKMKNLWWTTKNLLIIRPKFPNDGYTGSFSFAAAELVKTKAVAEGWTVTDLQINDANRAKLTQIINSTPIDFVIHYDHGGDFVMCGQNNNAFENAIDNNNAALLGQSSKHSFMRYCNRVRTISCIFRRKSLFGLS